jgi:Divergent InlB B-repeat domain
VVLDETDISHQAAVDPLFMSRFRPHIRSRVSPLVALALLALAAPADAAHSPEHVLPAFGVGALRAETLADYPLGLADLQRMGQTRLGLYRPRFREDQVLVDGSFSDWSRLDNLARAAALDGVALQPVLINMPGEIYTPPKTDAERARFAAFAGAAVQRYGPSGSFWSGCDCPKLPAMVWEVWNEPNITPFWDFPNPAEYGALLKDTAAALRAADPSVRVLFGGLAYPSTLTATRLEPNAFLRDVIAAVGAEHFDALALHNYRPNPERAVNTLIADTVATLKTYAGATADGAPAKQVWLNEFGRPTVPDDPVTPEDEQASSEEAQRVWLESFLDLLLPHRADWNLGPVMWYSLRDGPAATASSERLGLRRTTLEDTDGGPKPSWDTYTARSVSADELYLPGLYDLTVSRTGAGGGTVTSSPGGIDCGTACSGSYAAGAVVTLSAIPGSGSSFTGWSGDCSGTDTCTLTMSQARGVSAGFEPVPPTPPLSAPVRASPARTTNALAPEGTGEVDSVAPAIGRLALSPVAFHAARSGTALAAATGTRLSLALSEAATVTFRIARAAPGRKVAGHCRRPTAHNSDRRRCTRWILLRGSIVRKLTEGPSALRYRGRLAGRTLAAGRYRLLVRARDAAGNLSTRRWVTFVVLA